MGGGRSLVGLTWLVVVAVGEYGSGGEVMGGVEGGGVGLGFGSAQHVFVLGARGGDGGRRGGGWGGDEVFFGPFSLLLFLCLLTFFFFFRCCRGSHGEIGFD